MRWWSVPLQARPQGSKRHIGGGRMIEQSGALLKQYRETVSFLARREYKTPYTGAVTVSLVFHIKRPKKHYRGDKRVNREYFAYPAKRGDIDKLTRSTLDALTGIAYQDDAQVCRLIALCQWTGEDSYTEIYVAPSPPSTEAAAA